MGHTNLINNKAFGKLEILGLSGRRLEGQKFNCAFRTIMGKRLSFLIVKTVQDLELQARNHQ